MKLAIGCDHAGFEMKEYLRRELEKEGHQVIDVGTYSAESADYPIYAVKCGQEIINGNAELGVLVCGSGIGISIAANKVKGIRCGIGYNLEVAKLMRMHNNCNIIAFGARFMEKSDVLERVHAFIETPFEGGRHERRVCMMSELE